MSRVPCAAPAPSAESLEALRPAKEHEPDLDEYLMASGEEDEEGEFDPEDFDHFVNSGVRRQGCWGLTLDKLVR